MSDYSSVGEYMSREGLTSPMSSSRRAEVKALVSRFFEENDLVDILLESDEAKESFEGVTVKVDRIARESAPGQFLGVYTDAGYNLSFRIDEHFGFDMDDDSLVVARLKGEPIVHSKGYRRARFIPSIR